MGQTVDVAVGLPPKDGIVTTKVDPPPEIGLAQESSPRPPTGQAGQPDKLLFLRNHDRDLGDNVFVELHRDLELPE